MTVYTSSAPNPKPDAWSEIAQMGELTDACRGQITGAFVEVMLPSGQRMRVDAVAFTGSAPINRTLILRAVPSRSHDAEIVYHWHQPDQRPRYESPEFYERGSVVTISAGPVSITIDRDGVADYLLTSVDVPGWTKRLRHPDEFRAEYSSDADLPTDDGVLNVVEHNPWFDLYPGHGIDAGDSLDDGVAHNLSEAIADAKGRIQ